MRGEEEVVKRASIRAHDPTKDPRGIAPSPPRPRAEDGLHVRKGTGRSLTSDTEHPVVVIDGVGREVSSEQR